MAGGYESSGRSSSQGGSCLSFERSVSGEFIAGRGPAHQLSSGPNQSLRTRRGGGTADGDAGVTAARRKKIESARNSATQPLCNILSFANWRALGSQRGLLDLGNIKLRYPLGCPNRRRPIAKSGRPKSSDR